MRFIILYVFVSGVTGLLLCRHWPCYNVNAFLFSAHAIDLKRKTRPHHQTRIESLSFWIEIFIYDHKWCDNSMDKAYNVWRSHNKHFLCLTLWAMMFTFAWQIDTLYVVCGYRCGCGCGWWRSLFGICHAFFIQTVFFIFCPVPLLAPYCSLQSPFFLLPRTVHQLKWADITLIWSSTFGWCDQWQRPRNRLIKWFS